VEPTKSSFSLSACNAWSRPRVHSHFLYGFYESDCTQARYHARFSTPESARIPRFDRWLVEQNYVQQGIMDLDFSVVFDKTQFAEFVHEEAHTRSGRADHLRKRFLTKRSHDRLWPAFLPEICKEKEKPSEALFARIIGSS
jgi:hypothetical protein